MTRLKQIGWTLLALTFLAVSWAWEAFAPIVQAMVDLLPLRRLKAWAHALLESLSPYATLLVFIIPLALSEAVKIVSFVAFARGAFFAGVLIYLFAEVVRFGLAAYVWNVCREKLLSIGWVAKLHEWLLQVHDWAQRQTAPIKAWIARALAEAGLSGGKASLWLRIKALWRYSRSRSV